MIRIDRETLRCLRTRRGITFQRTTTRKESTGPDRDTKPDRIEYVIERFPHRAFALDESGPPGIRWGERVGCPAARRIGNRPSPVPPHGS